MCKNILVEYIHRNGGVRDVQKYWLSRYIELEVSGMHKNILVK